MEKQVSYSISVDFTPWSENGYMVIDLRLFEEIGGELAKGTMNLEFVGTDEAFDDLLKQYTGKLIIKKEAVVVMTIDIFIIKRKFNKNFLSIEFLCLKDIKFVTELISLEHSDITTALESLYPGNIDIRCTSDISNDTPVLQFMETNHSFCNKMAYSFKKDIIFGYSWEGFFLKDRIGEKNSKGEVETADNTNIAFIGGGGGHEPLDPYSIKYNNLLYKKSWDPWTETESEEDDSEVASANFTPINSKTIKFYDNYLTLGTSHYCFAENYLYNKARMTDNMYAAFRVEVKDIPNYKLGDVVHYRYLNEAKENIKIPYEYFLVKTNELYISVSEDSAKKTKSDVFWVSTLVSLVDHNGALLPETDPMIEISEDGKIS